ncbi:MAG TPA: ABC transporter permease [Streptosporangiaceae bacterium]|nr:ABC transporter permease [Streptosporangiaceae bacterium]
MIRRRLSPPTTLRPADAISEAVTAIVARPARAVVTCIGTVLGVAWFVTALGLASTASGQVAAAFTKQLSTHVLISPKGTGPAPAASPYPIDVERRLDALRGVVAAGVFWPLRLSHPVVVSAMPEPAASGAGVTTSQVPVLAATPGFLAAAGVQVSQGRTFDAWDQAHRAQVCVVGAAAATAMGVSDLRRLPTIYIDDVPCAVIGIVGRASERQSVLRSVMLPAATAAALWGPPDARAGAVPMVMIRTRPGAATVVARQAPFAISATRPQHFAVAVAPGPVRLRDQVMNTLTSMFFALGWVSLAIGTLSIASITWLSVRERTAEFGLRRAVGARRRHIVAHVVSESAILGVAGGLAGASLGVAVVILLAWARGWVPVLAPLTVLPAPLAGAAAGVLAGLVPGLIAARIQPAAALATSIAG